MNQVEDADQRDLFEAQIIPLRLAITAMRDSGYKNTAYALAELIDNAVQAEASMIEVLCTEKRERVQQRVRSRLWQIAVLDNGTGMDAKTLRMALQFGNGTRLGDRTGIGRFGMGLPNASISQANRLEVWTWQNGPDNAIRTYIDLGAIDRQEMASVPPPEHQALPQHWRDISDHIGQHGTLVLWSELDFQRLTWKRAKRALERTEEIVGRVYRRFVADGTTRIRLFAVEQNSSEPIIDREVVVNDPLYLTPSPSMPAPFDTGAMFEEVFEDEEEIEFEGQVHTVRLKYSVASEQTVTLAGHVDRGKTAYGAHAARNMGVSVLRAGREIMLDHNWCIGYDPRERWWGAEVEFPPALDEVFGVTNNKQAATHFAELASTDWKELAEEGEGFMDVVDRLKQDGDLRGYLLNLSDAIKRTLIQLRDRIKAQSRGRRSSRKSRHDEPDDATKAANKGWKERSKERPLEEDAKALSQSDLEEIRADLTEEKSYTETEARELVQLIKDENLKVVFLEQDFPNATQLFNVDMKGSVTEIVFNRQHPSFEDIFGTVATVDEDVNSLSREEAQERLGRAVNGAKVVFAAWGRYEREAGIDRGRALRRVRDEWGQIAAKFVEPEEEFDL